MVRAVSLVAAILLLGACGESSAPTSGDSNDPANAGPAADAKGAIDPCSLLTPDDVTAVIGDKVTTAETDGTTCRYTYDDGDMTVEVDGQDAKGKMEIDRKVGGVLGGLGAQAEATGGAAGADLNKMMSEGGDAPKVGDEALWGAASQLSVRKGDVYVAITPPIMHSRMSWQGNPLISTEEKRKMALALAEKALSRLP